MMRALFCLKGPNETNGPNVWLTRHLPRLIRHGIEPRVLYVALDPDEPCRFLTALQDQGIGVRKVKLGRFTEEDVPAILEGIVAERPDVFVPNYTAAAYFACRFAREAGIRTIGTLHSDDPYYHDIVDVFLRGAEPWRLDGVVAVSDYLTTLAAEAATSSTHVLHATYGAPIAEVTAAEPEEVLTLLYVGRLVERQKRIRRVTERMLAAAAAVDDVRGLLYGDGPERGSVEGMLSRDESDRVRLGGVLSPDAMMPAMVHGHALVLLSDFEGLSIALMEAMACGLVPIVSDTRSGTGDLIQHDVNALVVDADSDASFTEAVRRLREEQGLWARLSGAAREAIIARGYTSDECARRWAEFCTHLTLGARTQAISVPSPADVFLPARCERPFGLRIDDRRDPWQRLTLAMLERRPIYVWGAGSGGRQFLASRTGREISVAGVIDRRAVDDTWTLENVPVFPPAHLADQSQTEQPPFIVITSMYETEIGRDLEQLGFRSERDFISA
jgi:glycosyltransferase involved in cell wall biosynthesis